jgi:polyferredoxin
MLMRALLIALLLLLPDAAAAHGEHAAAPASEAAAVAIVQGYRIELVTHPSPPVAGQPGHLMVSIASAGGLGPATGGHVLMGLVRPGVESSLQHATEATWSGTYAIPVTAERRGAYRARVVIEALDGQHFEPPLTAEFPVSVAAASGLVGWTSTLLLGLIAIAGVGLYGAAVHARLGRTGEDGVNLLAVPWIRRLITAPALQPVLQAPLLVLLAIVVALGFVDVQDGGVNLATKLTWTIWWAGIIFTFVLAGRVWCLACPFGALNEWTSRLAGPLRRLPRPFRNIWWATGMFVLLTWADEQLGVVRSPRVTAGIVLFFTVAAVAIGLFYERRSFCRYLCPIGGLIGIYSMTAPVELRPRERAICAADREKACYRGSRAAAGCPMFEFPGSLDRNTYCTLCARCVSGCSHDNLVLRLRAFGKDLWTAGRRALDEAYLAVVLVGLTLLVTAQMLTGWADWMSALARWLPIVVRTHLKPVTYLGLVESVVLLGGSLVVGPLLVLAAAALANRLAGPAGLGLRRTFVVFGYMFVPVGLAMHLAHNLAHLLLEGGGIVPVLQRAIALYTPFSLGVADWEIGPLAPGPVVSFVQMAILVGFFVLSMVAGQRLAVRVYADARAASRALIPMVVLALLFTAAGIVLLSLPMGMRHGM